MFLVHFGPPESQGRQYVQRVDVVSENDRRYLGLENVYYVSEKFFSDAERQHFLEEPWKYYLKDRFSGKIERDYKKEKRF